MTAGSVGWLPAAAYSTVGNAILTVLAVAAAAAALWAARRGFAAVRDHPYARVVDVAVAGGLLGVVAAAAGFVVYVWSADWLVAGVQAVASDHLGAAVTALVTLLVVAGAYVGTGLCHRLVQRVADTSDGVSEHQAEVIYRVLQLGVYALAALATLSVWGVNLGGLLVGAGFAGIVLGMAARQTLGSLIAGLVLMFSRPFEIGDWVQIGDKEGIVTDITIVNTRIQTFDGEYVMLPNDAVSSNDIVNRTRKGRLRVEVEVGVDYDADLDDAADAAREAMADLDEILAVPRPQVVVKEFAASSIDLGLRFWIDRPSARKRWRARTAVIKAVKAEFDDRGVKIPFPQRELAGRAEAGGFRLADDQDPTVPREPDEVVENDD
jgi:small-conductance mechanosensitive channel